MMTSLIPVIAMSLIAPPTPPAEAASASVKALGLSSQAFTSNLLRAVHTKGANSFVSPYSIQTAMWMAGSGGRGATQEQIRTTLHLKADADGAFGALHALLVTESKTRKPARSDDDFKPMTLTAANRLWHSGDVAIKEGFATELGKNFAADVASLNFRNGSEAANTVNTWVAKETHDRIKKLISPEAVPSSGVILTNAVYFKGAWSSKFDAMNEMAFTTGGGEHVKPKGMTQEGTIAYQDLPHVQIVQIPYQGNAVMTVILPEAGKFESVLATLDLAKVHPTFPGRKVIVTMPKFSIHRHASVKETLASMGIKDAFDKGKADFSPMAAAPLFVADVIHAANIDVDENGTEAAAATAVMMAPTSMPMAPKSEPILFTADRPFVFVISHTTSGEVLFAGIVNNPAAKD